MAKDYLASLFEPVDEPNRLFYGDNLDVLSQHVGDESVDLVYLDPPFNSNRNYNVLFARHETQASDAAQIKAFDDTWHWTPETDTQYKAAISGGLPAKVADALAALRTLLGENDATAYLVNMAPRLVELHRVLKPTGSLYLHCHPTMSHYLKVMLDTIFGPKFFRNEVSWKRFSAKNDPHRFGRSHDVILFYSRDDKFTWNVQYGPFEQDYVEENYRYVEEGTGRRYRRDNLTANKPGGDVSYEWHGARPYKGRYWAYSREKMDQMLLDGRIEFRRTGMPVYKRYLDEQPGVPLQDIWTDIRLHSGSKERLGYPTQKPVALLERIVTASSNEGDLVLDPFCGCGTTIEAAERLGRRWIGIDITYLAIDQGNGRGDPILHGRERWHGSCACLGEGWEDHRPRVRPRPARHRGDAEGGDGRARHHHETDAWDERRRRPCGDVQLARQRPEVPEDPTRYGRRTTRREAAADAADADPVHQG